MPQPTTHYLVTRRAIPKEYWSDWWDKFKPYFGLGSTAPDLFYFPRISSSHSYSSKLSDAIHSESSYNLFCLMLDIAKNNKTSSNDLETAEKQFAFAVGFYEHVVTDCIFHPYVYRSSKDHWNSTDFSNETNHKIQEFRIDRGIHREIRGKDQEIGTTAWQCPGESAALLEWAIVDLFNSALTAVYPTQFNTNNKSVSDNDHPIQQAYRTLNNEIPLLYMGQQLFLWGKGIKYNTAAIIDNEHFYTSKYFVVGLDSHTPQDLFNLSCVICRNVFLTSLDYFNNNHTQSSKAYFSNHQVNYLGVGNWNLDTGLPCEYNSDEMMLKECPEHYLYKAEILRDQYIVFNQLYSSFESE